MIWASSTSEAMESKSASCQIFPGANGRMLSVSSRWSQMEPSEWEVRCGQAARQVEGIDPRAEAVAGKRAQEPLLGALAMGDHDGSAEACFELRPER